MHWIRSCLHIKVVMLALAAGHLIKREADFQSVLHETIAVAEQGKNVVSIGITPNRLELRIY